MLLLVDANVLIDYANTDPTVLSLVARHLGPVHVPRDVLDEVRQLDEEACDRLGLLVVEGTLGQLLEAGAAGGALSFADWMCLILARRRGDPRDSPVAVEASRRPLPRADAGGRGVVAEVLEVLRGEQAMAILRELLRRHPTLRAETDDLVRDLVSSVDPLEVAAGVRLQFRALTLEGARPDRPPGPRWLDEKGCSGLR